MLQSLELAHENVLGFRVKGKLDFDSITRTSRHLSEQVSQNGEVSILLEVPDHDDMEFYEMWKSIRYALAHFRQNIGHIASIAVVSDARWVHRAAEHQYTVLSGVREKMFNSRDLKKALNWIGQREARMVA